MFKVGDKVVYRKQCSIIWDDVYTVDAVLANGDVIERDGQTPKEWLSHATPQEIAVGHRIDLKPSNSMELETLRDCDTSTNCKKFDERVK
ncbi:hypothetical protein EJP75_08500 [Acinetobacter baumannii]|nr:hypothetical protein EJP75_08500 [Acinetobacter baumannii]